MFFIAGAGVGCFYLLVSSMAVLRHQRRDRIPPRSPVSVTILKPLHGAEPRLAERLASFCDQTYGAPVQLVCGVHDAADGAVAAVMQLADANPRADITLKIDGHQHGSNRKISNLANILPLARHETLVIADSDIEVGPNYLASITANLAQSGVGAVTCLYHGVGGPGPWSQLAALAINAHFLPNVVSAVSFGLAQPCFGSTVAMSRATLSRIGGLETFANCLADDYAIGAAVREAGLKVAIPSFSVAHVCFETSLHGLLTHELRAARTIKSIDRLGYCGTIISHPLPLALISVSLGGGAEAMLLAALALACRGALCLSVEHAFGLQRQAYWLLPFRDLLSFAVFVLSFFGASVSWRGARYRLGRGGRMISDRHRAAP